MNFLLTVIPPPSLTITANPGSVTIIQGQSGETTLTFAPMNGYVGNLDVGLHRKSPQHTVPLHDQRCARQLSGINGE